MESCIHTYPIQCLWEVFVWGFGVLFFSCACVSVSGVLFSVGVCVCVCDLLICLHLLHSKVLFSDLARDGLAVAVFTLPYSHQAQALLMESRIHTYPIHRLLIYKQHASTHAEGADPRVWGLAPAGSRVGRPPAISRIRIRLGCCSCRVCVCRCRGCCSLSVCVCGTC